MRQVPQYCIIGNGRMAKHFCHYLSILNISYSHWYRDSNLSLTNVIEQIPNILLLISDSAIIPFIEDNPVLRSKQLFHFSGCLYTEQAYGFHPLMTFTHTLYDLKTYQQIPFICDDNAPVFSEVFPNLNNPVFTLPKSLKSKYHSFCVLSGNFTTILWKKFFHELSEQFNLEPNVAFPYLQQIVKNLISNPKSALTGPLARNDEATLSANLAALESDPFQQVYAAFVNIKETLNECH